MRTRFEKKTLAIEQYLNKTFNKNKQNKQNIYFNEGARFRQNVQ